MRKVFVAMLIVMAVVALIAAPAFAKGPKCNTQAPASVSQYQSGTVQQIQVGKGLNVQGYCASGEQGYTLNTSKPKGSAFGLQGTSMGAGQIGFGNQSQAGIYENFQGVTIK